MTEAFNDINYPRFVIQKDKKESNPKKFVTGVDDSNSVEEKKCDNEVRLISTEWKPGPEGFQYNKQCFLEVKAEFLKVTNLTRIRGKLHGIYKGEDVDLSQEVVGFINRKTNIAKMEIKHLWFINDKHGDEWHDDKNIPAKYYIKDIFHIRGENKIDSTVLEMPVNDELEDRIKIVLYDSTSKNRLPYHEFCIYDGDSHIDIVESDENGEYIIKEKYNDLSIDVIGPGLNHPVWAKEKVDIEFDDTIFDKIEVLDEEDDEDELYEYENGELGS